MLVNILALVTALAVSAVAAIFSIIGLTTIFSGAYWSIVVMGGVLELGKIVTASWLYRNWDQTPLLLKGYLTSAVIVLIIITSMGIFGYLSKAHIDQQIELAGGASQQIEILDNRIKTEQQIVDDLDIQIRQIDSALEKMVSQGNAKTALASANQQRKLRDVLVSRRDTRQSDIADLRTERIRLSGEQRKIEAEVGPIKYLANVVYGQSDNSQLETAVRWMIIIIVAVFDPLAVVLLIAANIGLTAPTRYNPEDKNIIPVHKDRVTRMEKI